MQIRVHTFMNLHKWWIRLLFAPYIRPSNEIVCQISLKTRSELVHVVRASDNKDYDAFYLQTWLRKQSKWTRNLHVIPSCNIQWVSSPNLWIVVVLFRLPYMMCSSILEYFHHNLPHIFYNYTKVYTTRAEPGIARISKDVSDKNTTSPRAGILRGRQSRVQIPGHNSAFTPYHRPHSR